MGYEVSCKTLRSYSMRNITRTWFSSFFHKCAGLLRLDHALRQVLDCSLNFSASAKGTSVPLLTKTNGQGAQVDIHAPGSIGLIAVDSGGMCAVDTRVFNLAMLQQVKWLDGTPLGEVYKNRPLAFWNDFAVFIGRAADTIIRRYDAPPSGDRRASDLILQLLRVVASAQAQKKQLSETLQGIALYEGSHDDTYLVSAAQLEALLEAHTYLNVVEPDNLVGTLRDLGGNQGGIFRKVARMIEQKQLSGILRDIARYLQQAFSLTNPAPAQL